MSQKTLQKYISRLMALLLCALLILTCVPVVRADGGSCGSGLNWNFDGSTLTISGSGAMYDYSESNKAPWDSVSGQIQNLILPDGLTRIGNRAFYKCTALISVSIPGSVQEIGDAAFCKSSSMTMLTLNSGLKAIGRSAFESCTSLQEVRLPSTVTEIGNHAFYCCENLSYVYIPASVQSFGSGIFSYCTRLSRVDMDGSVSSMPNWSFYGCDSLSQIHAQGTVVDASEFKQTNDPVVLKPQSSGQIADSIPGNGTGVQEQTGTQMSTQEQTGTQMGAQGQTEAQMGMQPGADTGILEAGNSATGSIVDKTDNAIITNDITITQNENTVDVNVDISATVITPEGWTEIVDQIQNSQNADTDETTTVTIFVPDNAVVPGEVVQELAGTSVDMTINISSGTKFKVDFSDVNAENVDGDLDLSYSITLMDMVPDGINALTAYQLIFNASCAIKVEAMIRLPLENVRHAASLYQLGSKDSYDFLQSVVVDNEGYAHYYLAAIDKDIQYLIAMDVQGEQSAQAIIPNDLYDEYTLVDHSTGKPYVITGRSSSWNMGLGKVMAILAVVMVSAIVVVGAVMFFWNKQRLKAGYVPQWDDEEENT